MVPRTHANSLFSPPFCQKDFPTMQYTMEIEINLPRDRVIELFNNEENLDKWMDGLQSYETLSGSPGQTGATAKLVFQMDSRRIEMTETILNANFPEEFDCTYVTKGVHNLVRNRFLETSDQSTTWESEYVFRFSGIVMRTVGFFLRKSFPKQSYKYMKNFKAFAEANG